MADSTASGPSSTYVVTPAASRAAIPSANRTASRTCRTQYSGSVTSPDEAIGIVGARNVSPDTTRRNSSSIGSINGEWNA
ncbi:hypothetical protein GCM10009557_95430 [Virgisporangium ochraceum]